MGRGAENNSNSPLACEAGRCIMWHTSPRPGIDSLDAG